MAHHKEHVTLDCYAKQMELVQYLQVGNIFFVNLTKIVTDVLCIMWDKLVFTNVLFLGCTVNGGAGDGTTRGTCNQGQFCQSDGTCTSSKSTIYVHPMT